jgi:hypothetical protein
MRCHIHVEVWAYRGVGASLRTRKTKDVIVINPLIFMDLNSRKEEIAKTEAGKDLFHNTAYDVRESDQKKIWTGVRALVAAIKKGI